LQIYEKYPKSPNEIKIFSSYSPKIRCSVAVLQRCNTATDKKILPGGKQGFRQMKAGLYSEESPFVLPLLFFKNLLG
jgi:hypothetical protein